MKKIHLPPIQSFCAISDLHLSDHMPKTFDQFEWFCQQVAPSHDALFLLGDLFEFWLGDDALSHHPVAQKVAKTLLNLSVNIPIYYIHGNRDFAIGEDFARAAGMTILPDPYVVEIKGERFLFSHGDLLCTLDLEYQKTRRIFTHPWVKGVVLKTPLSWRLKLAQHLRDKSQKNWEKYANKPGLKAHQDVVERDAQKWCETHQAHHLIHGHTHLRNQHQLSGYTRWVLSDWDLDHQQPRWGYLLKPRHGDIQLVNV